MFFVKFESAKNEFSPSYSILSQQTEDEAEELFLSTFTPYRCLTTSVTHFVTLYETGEAMGKETFIDGASVRLTESKVPLWEGITTSYSHPQDYTVHHDTLPDGMLEELEPLLEWKHLSFPNGSNYSRQKLPSGTFTLPSFGEVEITSGYRITCGWNIYKLSNATVDVGPGVNLGAHFNNRDQELVAFRK